MATPAQRKQAVVQRASVNLANSAQLDLVKLFVQGVREANRAIPKHMQQLADLFDVGAIPNNQKQETFDRLGKAGQQAVIRSYRQRSYRPNVGTYRAGTDPRRTRFAGGKLARALASPRFYTATSDGLQFINVQLLNQEARQWRRLNFGAGAAAGEPPGRFPLSFVQASIGLEPDPRPAFLLPPGFWLRNGEVVPPGQRGTAQFYPYGGAGSRGRARTTRGIQAVNFLDAGIKRIGKNFGPEFEGLYDRFYKDRKARARGQERLRVKLTPIRSRIY